MTNRFRSLVCRTSTIEARLGRKFALASTSLDAGKHASCSVADSPERAGGNGPEIMLSCHSNALA
jgi:hypothetical protein